MFVLFWVPIVHYQTILTDAFSARLAEVRVASRRTVSCVKGFSHALSRFRRSLNALGQVSSEVVPSFKCFVLSVKWFRPYIKTYRTCVAPPTNKMSFRRFFAQIYDWKHLYLCIFLVRHPATTSATVLLPKCTTRRWTLRCSNYSVAERQQFSCALSAATLSLKFENVVQGGWI